jgi:Fe2+ or Zn2+ uptake regulation protein
MSDEKPPVDESLLGDAKGKLEHVETKTTASTAHPVFKCENCGHTEDIPQEKLDKMEADERVDFPEHCGQKMKISVSE